MYGNTILIDKKQLKLARTCLRVGLIVMTIALIGMIAYPELIVCKIFVCVGVVPSFFGAFRISGFYRCPRCRESILLSSAMGALKEECVSHCPRCGSKVDVEITE